MENSSRLQIWLEMYFVSLTVGNTIERSAFRSVKQKECCCDESLNKGNLELQQICFPKFSSDDLPCGFRGSISPQLFSEYINILWKWGTCIWHQVSNSWYFALCHRWHAMLVRIWQYWHAMLYLTYYLQRKSILRVSGGWPYWSTVEWQDSSPVAP